MKPFVLLATLVVLVNGRPEPPSGYNYPRPGGSHHQISTGGSFIGGGNFIGGGQHFTGGHQTHFQTGSSHFQTGSTSFDGGNFNNANTFNSNNIFAGNQGGSIDFGGSSSGSLHGHPSGGVTVQKHIYVHVPPPEPEEHHVHRPIPVAQAQKHYKIIFIKAPTQATPTAPTIPLQAQNEEKTLVYVLVKKPEEQPEITIPTAAPTQPSKPEVYFIRYKTKKEGGGVINSGVTGGITGSGSDIGSSLTGSIGGISGSIGGIHGGSEIISTGGSHTSITSSGTSGTSSVYGPPGHVSGGPY